MKRNTVNVLAGFGALFVVFGLACLLHTEMNDYNPYDGIQISQAPVQAGLGF